MKKKIAGLPDAEYITPTKEDLERRFKEYNEKYFDGVLPKCSMTLTQSKSGWGLYVGGKNIKTPRIYISKYVFWTDETLKLIFIHEMVHHYVRMVIQPKHYVFPHGRTFNKVCDMLRKKHGLRVRLHELPQPYYYKEKIPTTYFGKLWRKYWGPRF